MIFIRIAVISTFLQELSRKLVIEIERGKISFEMAKKVFFAESRKIVHSIIFERKGKYSFLRGGERIYDRGKNTW